MRYFCSLARLLSACRRAACRVGHGFPRGLLSSPADPRTWFRAGEESRGKGRARFQPREQGKAILGFGGSSGLKGSLLQHLCNVPVVPGENKTFLKGHPKGTARTFLIKNSL